MNALQRTLYLSILRLTSCEIAFAQHSVATVNKNEPWLAESVKTEAPAYPFVAKYRRWQGKGLFHLTIDQRTGKVADVRVIKSTGFRVLDDSAIIALRAWVWRPNRLKQIDIPVTFQLQRSGRFPNISPSESLLPSSPY